MEGCCVYVTMTSSTAIVLSSGWVTPQMKMAAGPRNGRLVGSASVLVHSVNTLKLVGSKSFLVRSVNIPRLVDLAIFLVRSISVLMLVGSGSTSGQEAI